MNHEEPPPPPVSGVQHRPRRALHYIHMKATKLTSSLHATTDDVKRIRSRLSKQSCDGTAAHLL